MWLTFDQVSQMFELKYGNGTYIFTKQYKSDEDGILKFWRQGGSANTHQISGNLEKLPFHAILLLKQKLCDGKG